MSRPIALLTADWHVMKHAWTKRTAISGDAEFGLWQIAAAAKKHQLPILAAGDQFHSMTPGRGMMIRTADFLHDVDGFYIQGNHDRVYPSWMKLVARHWLHLAEQPVELVPENMTQGESPDEQHLMDELKPLFESDMTWRVYGFDYIDTPEALREKLDELGRTIKSEPGTANLLVLHQATFPFMPRIGCELLDDMIPDGIDMLVTGHVHEARTAQIRTCGGQMIPSISPGGTHLLAVNQDANKKLFFLYADGSVRSRRLVTRRKLELDLRGMNETQIRAEIERVTQDMANAKRKPDVIQTPIVYAVFDETVSNGVKDILEESFGTHVHLFLKEETGEDESNGIDLARLEDIDVEHYRRDGFEYAKENFYRYEPDRHVRTIVENLLDTEVNQTLYKALKEDFRGGEAC